MNLNLVTNRRRVRTLCSRTLMGLEELKSYGLFKPVVVTCTEDVLKELIRTIDAWERFLPGEKEGE